MARDASPDGDWAFPEVEAAEPAPGTTAATASDTRDSDATTALPTGPAVAGAAEGSGAADVADAWWLEAPAVPAPPPRAAALAPPAVPLAASPAPDVPLAVETAAPDPAAASAAEVPELPVTSGVEVSPPTSPVPTVAPAVERPPLDLRPPLVQRRPGSRPSARRSDVPASPPPPAARATPREDDDPTGPLPVVAAAPLVGDDQVGATPASAALAGTDVGTDVASPAGTDLDTAAAPDLDTAAAPVASTGPDVRDPSSLASAGDGAAGPTSDDETAGDDPTREGPPSSRAGRRRAAAPAPPSSPLRALTGAAVAVAGVALGIGALLLLRGGDDIATPTVAQTGAPAPLAEGTPADPAPSTGAPATPAPETSTPGATAPTPAPPAPSASAAPSAAPAAPAAPALVPLTVLNNSRITGLADRAAGQFADAGWPVATVGNFSGGPVPVTTVYFEPGQEDAAARLTRDFPGVVRVLPRPSGLPGDGLTVVLTRDFDA